MSDADGAIVVLLTTTVVVFWYVPIYKNVLEENMNVPKNFEHT